MGPIRTRILIPLAAALVAAGCGASSQVTYVDPNGADSGSPAAGEGGEPFVTYGADTLERARACITIRAALAVGRTVAATDPAATSDGIDEAIEGQLPTIEPRAAASAPQLATRLRAALEQLRDAPPTTAAAYGREVQRIDQQLLEPACDAVIAQRARQDIAFRAGMLQETLQDAANAYEESFGDDERDVQDTGAYRRAYGLLIDASTRQLESIPEDARPRIRATLDQISRRSTPGPTPPNSPRNPELVVGELAALADDVALAARIDTSYPEPDKAAPDQLRSLKRDVATALEAAERGDTADALARLRTADRTSLVPAASSIAAVSPSLVPELEQNLLVGLPTAIRGRADVTTAASEFDARIDEAISLIEDELDLLRDSQ